MPFGASMVIAAILASAEPNEMDWQWLSDNRDMAFEALMPIEGRLGTYVTYRSYRDLYQDVAERYFTIWRASGFLNAELVEPLGASAQQQLLEMHMRDRASSLESLLPRVHVRRIRIDESCPALVGQFERLAKLRFSLPERDVIIIHPDIHRIVIAHGAGALDASIFEDDHPLVVWAIDTFEKLGRCPEKK